MWSRRQRARSLLGSEIRPTPKHQALFDELNEGQLVHGVQPCRTRSSR